MRIFYLLRHNPPLDTGIFGVLKDGNVPFCVTVENNDYIFPEGDYLCKRIDSPKFGNTFEITGIEGRSHILFHWGKEEEDSLGCVILGETYTVVNNKEMVGFSRNYAFKEFLERTNGINEFMLKVRLWQSEPNEDKGTLGLRREDLGISDSLTRIRTRKLPESLIGTRKGFKVTKNTV